MEKEKRLIDANALIEKKRRYCSGHGEYEYMVELWHIEHAPTVDAVEVVRCKDCEFCVYNFCNDTYKCRSMSGMFRRVEPDEFCSYGERKEEQ